MGGMETKTITLKKLDTFSHIGLFSGGSIALGDIEDLEAFKKSNRLVFVSYGSRELGNGNQPRRGGDPKAAVDALKAAGVNSVFYVSPDTAHEWQSWRRSLKEMAPLLFQPARRWSQLPAPAATGVTGKWHAEFDTQIGKQIYDYTIQQDGRCLHRQGGCGRSAGTRWNPLLTEGKVDGDKVSFTETLKFQDNELAHHLLRHHFGQRNEAGPRQVGEVAKEDVVAKRERPAAAPAEPGSKIRRRSRRPAWGRSACCFLAARPAAAASIATPSCGTSAARHCGSTTRRTLRRSRRSGSHSLTPCCSMLPRPLSPLWQDVPQAKVVTADFSGSGGNPAPEGFLESAEGKTAHGRRPAAPGRVGAVHCRPAKPRSARRIPTWPTTRTVRSRSPSSIRSA